MTIYDSSFLLFSTCVGMLLYLWPIRVISLFISTKGHTDTPTNLKLAI